ncbi:MAG: triacylglycerol lipase [Pseudomonadales bacterium]|nr:triacylglycerol lipase [Pseudomonadales bacterium]
MSIRKILAGLAVLFAAQSHAFEMDCSNISIHEPAPNSGTYNKTKYPIVMAHGWFGFDELLGVDYWYGIIDKLTDNGATVYVTQQAAMNSSLVRGDQLLKKVRCILAISGAEKVNLIAHSQGTLDARYVAGEAPELVASVTSVSGPNHGSIVSNFANYVDTESTLMDLILSTGETFGYFIDYMTGAGYDMDGRAFISVEAGGWMTDSTFNDNYPAGLPEEYCGEGPLVDNGIYFYSWTGNQDFTNFLDPFSYLDKALSLALANGEVNDGLVTVCSSHLGRVIRNDYKLDHFDTVNQLFGLRAIFSPNPVTLYKTQVNRLKNQGL